MPDRDAPGSAPPKDEESEIRPDEASTEGKQRRMDDSRKTSVRRAIRNELDSDRPEGAQRQAVRADAPGTTPIVQLDHVSLAFDRPILEDVSFMACEGETVAIV